MRAGLLCGGLLCGGLLMAGLGLLSARLPGRLLGALLPVAHARAPALPRQALGVPLSRQQTPYSCGPAVLRSVLQYFGVWDGPEQELYRIVNASVEEGTLPEELAAGARHFGLTATVTDEPLMTLERLRLHLGLGKLVIVQLQAWRDAPRKSMQWREVWEDGHYVVLVGLDEEYAYFMDPSTSGAYTYVPLRELVERWHDVNPIRPVPLEPVDLQLGVVIGDVLRRARPRAVVRTLIQLE